ncbi:MAG: signal peptidase II [Candidatus Moranbacteria bacterium]|nr:signal peptidase II [Candidatus Moranbacteria bacterium]
MHPVQVGIMDPEIKTKKILFALLFFALVPLDQFSKYLIRQGGGFYICNINIAWGIKVPEILFWLFWLLAITILIFAFISKKSVIHNSLFIIPVLAGATSNIIDRIMFGCVIDFIDLKFWPAFNLADSFIVLGGILLLVKYLKL